MTYGVLHVQGHFGETYGKAVGHENGVVAETFAVAVALCENLSIDAALEILGLTALDEADDGAEVGAAVGLAFKCCKQFIDVVVEGAVLAGIAR